MFGAILGDISGILKKSAARRLPTGVSSCRTTSALTAATLTSSLPTDATTVMF